ncbi:leucine-rich repeat domain-containing protein [Bacteroides thetaiotaomicron]|uniref:Cell surface protein n=1 Tax=Bacteroides thetaiotaomicron TaxID=818 RepID=A0A174N6J4_BACT4|nr:leucine-rich repeat domain-containing protein [Bacteroides thetaiotaomicron]CUP44362.1 cell surface protein [Bacteroides thetaiotaomicron]
MSEDLKGTNVYAPIVPGTDEDRYPTHYSKYGKGGIKCVRTIAERDDIPLERLEVPTLCYVLDDDLFYIWDGSKWNVKEMGNTEIGLQRNVRIVNDLDNKNISASKGEPCYLKFTFISQERYSSKDPYENTGERGLCQISVRNSNNAEYVVVKMMYVNSATSLNVDVAEFLTSGANNVMIKITGEITEATTPAFVYTVQLTTLSINADNFKWWTAYSGDILFNLNIGGNVSKTLFVTVTGTDYNELYEVSVGMGVYIETSYNYSIPHPGKTGVFNISAYVANSDGSIKTRTVSFNVICAMTGDQTKLIAINNVLNKGMNWAENTLFEYTMYDGDNVTTSAQFFVRKDTTDVYVSNEDSITCSAKHIFSLSLEIETMDNSGFDIVALVKDGDDDLTAPIIFAVDNSSGYSAVPGAVFYLNPKTRSNSQANRQAIVNEIDGSEVKALWEGVNWGNDCWTTNTNGEKVLRLMAGSLLTIDRHSFSTECARRGITIEIDYRVDNVTNYSEPVMTISSPSGNSFIGLNLYADDIIMHTQSLKDDSVQSLHTFEGKRTRLTLTVLPTAYGNPGFNLCILYINGRKNREFTYEDNDYFAQSGAIVIGSDYADVDVYGIREYASGLTSQGVLTNYINWLSDTEEKARVKAFNDILDPNGSEIDFDNTRDQFNCLVFDNTIPYMLDQTQRVGTLEVLFYDHPEWNVSITNVAAKGQGTSSMKYYLWNTRYQLDKNNSVITFADGTTGSKKWQMVPWIPAGQKFTAKKNYASSMQSHKIGSVNSYEDLYREMGLLNEAMQTEMYKNARVAVYQMPFVCFEKSLNDDGESVYTFKGLYTFGPDKGDKYTFGYDTDLFPDMISIEGADNSPLCTLFRVPWNPNKSYIAYNEDEEAFQYNGANSWDFGAGELENISKFIPAYNIVYQCSPRLLPFNGTLDELNAQLADYKNQPYEFWIAKAGDVNQYNVYYFESAEGRFIPSDIGEGQINLKSQLVDKGYGLLSKDLTGKNNDELNTLFINARISKFRREAPDFWHIQDTLTFMNNVEFNAGTDERAKNTYPYSFGMENSKWRWRIDDADTRFDTTNRGLPEKSYSVETHDVDETGASVWNGESNNFFNLMELAFAEEKTTNMRLMMTSMQALSGLKSGNDLEKLYAFYKKYFFNEAQEYFPSNAFNADARIAYENGKLAYNAGTYSNDTDPITQSLGDHYAAEQRWVTKRILYMMSKYNFGLFSANGSDTITVRAAGNTIKYELTPAMDMYPAIANGTSIIRGARTKAGDVCVMEIELSGSGDQQNAIQGASYLQDIGDWYNKNVQGSMIIQGRMLRDIRLGSKTEAIVISISSLTLSNCTSLQRLLLSNISTLSGTLNLAGCTHLQEVYADGTSLVQIILPKGGGLRTVEFSAYNQYLSLANYPLMTNEGVGIDLCEEIITDFFITGCPKVKPMQLLVSIMDAQTGQGGDHKLKRIRAVGFDETYDDSDMLDKLATLSNGTYEGLSSEGLAGEDEYPVLDGTITINTNAYEDSIEILRNAFKKLTLNINGDFYVRFKDAVIGNYFIDLYGDGVGITKQQIQSIDKIPNYQFKDNKEVTSFDEFQYFTGLSVLSREAFYGCSNLSSIILPSSLTLIELQAFRGTNISNIFIPKGVKSMQQSTFEECSNLKEVIFEEDSSLIELKFTQFRSCSSLIKIELPDTIEKIGDSLFKDCISLEYCHYPINSKITEITANCFENCNSLKQLPLTEYIISLGLNVFKKCTSLSGHLDLSQITSLGIGGFYGCQGIASVDISNLETIPYEAFRDCTSLNSVQFGRNLRLVDRRAFQNASIERLDLSYAEGLEIGEYAFCDNFSLKKLSLPNNCILNGGCFGNVNIQEDLIIKKGWTFIGGNQFRNCRELISVEVEEGITAIPTGLLGFTTQLKTVIFPSTITEIGDSFLHGNGWLCTFICKATVPPVITGNGYIGYGPFSEMYVPDESVDAYKTAPSWSNHASQIKPMSMLVNSNE